jgi:hypothetical protein
MDIQKTKEFLRSAVNRAPLIPIHTAWYDPYEIVEIIGDDGISVIQGPDLN